MIKFVLWLSSGVIYILRKLSGVRITTSGEIPPKGPVLFLANHFTRFETFVVPYILFSQHNRIARSLADDTVFVGWLGEYMRLAGSISNKNEARDCIIVDDFLSGKADWIIYPEGHMVKNKRISIEHGEFCIHTAVREGPVHTGATVLALKAEILRARMQEAKNEAEIKRFCSAHYLTRAKLEKEEHLQIVPLSITYYPVRPGENRLLLWLDKYFNLRGTRFFEELEIEINLLMDANMHLHFSKPVSVALYINRYLEENRGSLEDDIMTEKLIDSQRKVLINDVMAKVYGNVQINFDHIFILSLVTMPTLKVCPSYLKTLIYKNARNLRSMQGLNLHPQLRYELFKLILDHEYAPFVSAIKLAQTQHILYKDSEGDYLFDKNLLEREYDFNKVRVKDTLQVILNEIKWQKEIIDTAYQNAKFSEKELRMDNFTYLQNKEWKIYEREYLLYHDHSPDAIKSTLLEQSPKSYASAMDSSAEGSRTDKPCLKCFNLMASVGAPIVMYDEKNSVGLVFSHGYMAAPAEAKHLAEYLFARGVNVYLPRLRGHGTDPKALKHIRAKDWELDFERAFTAMRQVCEKVFIGGFSTGGLLALLHAARYPVDGVIAINSALKLHNLQVSYVVPSLHAFNEMISYLHAKGIKEWVENHSENPQINYPKHPLASIAQMEKVMTQTDKILENITDPILILQGDNDPVVNPESAQLIYNRVHSKRKKLVLLPRNNHTIITGEGETEVFESIYRFIEDVG